MSQRLDNQAVSPEGMRALGGVYQYVTGKTGLSHDLVNLVYLRVSQINGCAFCISSHSHDLLKAGMPQNKLLMLTAWRETPSLYNDEERAALAWAESVTEVAQTHVPDADYEAVSACFTPKQVVDLTLGIGLINVYNRLGVAFRRSPEGLTAE